MDPAVEGKFGVKSCRHNFSVADEGGKAIAAGEHIDGRSNFDDARCAYEDHLERPAGEGCFGGDNCGIDLAAVGVAFRHGIEDAQASLRGVAHLTSQKNCTGAGAEDGAIEAELL